MHLRPSGRWLWTLWLLACAVGSPAAPAAGPAEREKTDVVIQDNGDRLTGRILYVQFGLLQLSSKHSGSVAIEWPSVHTIVSQYEFRIERFGGQLYAGPIATSADGLTLIVSPGRPEEARLPMAEVARILPYDTDFWHRVDGSASVGYNYTKASQVSQASASLDAHYGGEKVDSQLNAHVVANNDPTGSSNQSQLTPRRSSCATTATSGAPLVSTGQREPGNPHPPGRRTARRPPPLPVRSGQCHRRCRCVYDQEWATGNAGPQGSAEGLFVLQWRVYKFVYPKASLDFSALAFPSITDSPRFRASANISLTFKMTDRFALKLSEYGNYEQAARAVDWITL